MSKRYNGHRNWNAWNVSLWINNDEGLYHAARQCIRHSKTRREAAESFIIDVGVDKTPDGAPYNVTNVVEAMRGM
jgi:hypothetical protein